MINFQIEKKDISINLDQTTVCKVTNVHKNMYIKYVHNNMYLKICLPFII